MTDRSVNAQAAVWNGSEPDPLRWKALALLGTAFFMTILDATIVLTGLPSMQQELGFSVSGVQWVLTAYVLTFGGLMLFFGRIADITGRRRMFVLGLILFVLSSALCGLAWDAWVMIAARSLQGVSAAIMAPTALSIVMGLFQQPEERNKALGIWGALGGIGATAGLLIGGVVTSGLGWEWIFFINVPIGVLLLVLSPRVLRETRDRDAPRVYDPLGAITVTAALTLLIYGVFRATDTGWTSLETLGLLGASLAFFVIFLIVESRAKAPLVPLRIFKLKTLVAGNLVIFAIGLAVDGMLFPLTFYAQDVLGYSAMQFGLMTAVMTGMSIVGAMVGQGLVTKLGLRPVAIVALLLIGIGCYLLIGVSVDGSFMSSMFLGLLIFGPGMGAAFVSAQIAALQGVPEEESGLASGLVDTSFNIGSALGIAIVATIALSHANEVAAGGVESKVALTEGLQVGFVVTVVFAVLGLLATFLLPGRPEAGPADDNQHEPAVALAKEGR